MMISDVIHEASTEHEVFFLLTAYLESLRYGDKLGTLPQELTRLPLSGAGDVQSRFIGIRTVLNTALESGRSHAIFLEAADIFGTAVDRLDRLAEKALTQYRSGPLMSSPQVA